MESRIGFLFKSTSLHGFKHLVHQNQKRWKKNFGRAFWTCFIAISFILMTRVLRSAIIKGSSSTSINLDTTYRDWVNTFPAVSVCFSKGRSIGLIKKSIGPEHNYPDGHSLRLVLRHYRVMQSLLFLNYQQPMEDFSLENCLEINETCGIDIQFQKKKLFPQTCHDFMDKVFFLSEEQDCLDIFKPIETELGTCFIANSLYSNGSNEKENLENFDSLPLRYSNNDNRERSLELQFSENDFFLHRVFIHTPEELPNGKQKKEFIFKKIGTMRNIDIKTVEFLNDHDVKYESIESRGCRFPFERFTTFSLPYSYNYCRYIKRIERELQTCNCTFPFGFVTNHTMNICQPFEFECLHEIAVTLFAELKTTEGIMNYIGDCLLPSCISMEIFEIGQTDVYFDSTRSVKINVINKPTLRYIRRVRFTKLDMTVQVGGIIGLFFGASALSVLELFYLIYKMFKPNNLKPLKSFK